MLDSVSEWKTAMKVRFEMSGKEVKTVLICDDQAGTRQALKALLAARGDDQSVRLVEIHQPSVVIMDARMPGIGGVEATRLIKHRWPRVKIVMLTMYGDTRKAAAGAGVDTFLLKGCQAETLFEAILD
jgi:DNA-binding NarL/FixJ family response regulator